MDEWIREISDVAGIPITFNGSVNSFYKLKI
jgi:hypothetical protein